MDGHTLAVAMGERIPIERYKALAGPFTQAMQRAGCTTVARAAMWCAQLAHESGGLKWVRELWGPTPAQAGYEGRRDLGNTQPGDGFRFRGRGALQLTGRHNYTRLSEWAHEHGFVPTRDFFVANPEALEQDQYVFLGAVWYWTVARPQLNELSDALNVREVTRQINGGYNGLGTRIENFQRAMSLGNALLEGTNNEPKEHHVSEKVLQYSRAAVAQDTFYNCGPASTQTVILAATGILVSESALGAKLGTTVNGTDYIGYFPRVLNSFIPGADYVHRDLPNYVGEHEKQAIWDDMTRSINAGHGVIINIVAPPSNYPRATRGGVNPRYRGGTVYHYIAGMGFAEDSTGRHIWIADSGFAPYGYWIDFNQLLTLIVPKGYTYSRANAHGEFAQRKEHMLFGPDQVAALHEIKVDQKRVIELLENINATINGLIPSRINPDVKFHPRDMLAVVDATNWSQFRLVEAIAAKLGIDPNELLEEAVAQDVQRTRKGANE